MAIGTYTNLSKAELLNELKTREGGLSKVEAEKRLLSNGRNSIEGHEVSWFTILLRQVKSPFVYILVATAILALVLGEKSDSLIVLIFVLLNTGVSFFQEYHSAKSLQLLKQFINPHAHVLRDGEEIVIDAATLVVGDIMIVETGDIIDADIRFIETTGLSINESVLSGESIPVTKTADQLRSDARDIHEAFNKGFSGTTVTAGRGVGVVVAIGKNTEIGGIATLTIETDHLSAFESSIHMFAKFIMKMVAVILVLLLVVNIFLKGTSNLMDLLFFAVALAISVIPEALPVVTTLSLSRGALQLAHHHVVVKRLSAVEDLGSIEVLCTDKTGTLTENKLSVSGFYGEDNLATLRYSGLAGSTAFSPNKEPADSFDQALWKKMTGVERSTLTEYKRLAEIPFEPNRRRSSVVVEHSHSKKSEIIVRGAPETILELSTLSREDAQKVLDWVKLEGEAGRRSIAIAVAVSTHPDHPEKDEKKMQFIGCVSFVDPIKETTRTAILDAEHLGISIVILTGDGPDVAGTVARDVGIIRDRTQVITEAQFLALSAPEQMEAIRKYSVFARMSPSGKYRVIELLSKNKIVGYLGDGINDTPALKIASVGLVVSNASDIARDAADVVLLNRSLHVIIGGIKSGRAVFENTVKYLKTTLISSFGNFYTIAIAQLILPYLPMLPIQILLLNLLSDAPMLAVATDTVDSHDIKKPHRYNVHDIVLIAIVLGLVSTVFDFIFFATFKNSPPSTLQTNWFIGSVLTEIVLLFAIRTRQVFYKAKAPSRILLILSAGAALLTIALPFTHFGQTFFKFAPPSLASIGIILAIVTAYFTASEGLKLIYYRFFNHTALIPRQKS